MAEKGHDFAGIEIDRGIVDRVDTAEGDRDVLQFDEGSALFSHGSYSSYFARER
ncbi:hypothetical protein D3C87_2190490 [compost metagenome]